MPFLIREIKWNSSTDPKALHIRCGNHFFLFRRPTLTHTVMRIYFNARQQTNAMPLDAAISYNQMMDDHECRRWASCLHTHTRTLANTNDNWHRTLKALLPPFVSPSACHTAACWQLEWFVRSKPSSSPPTRIVIIVIIIISSSSSVVIIIVLNTSNTNTQSYRDKGDTKPIPVMAGINRFLEYREIRSKLIITFAYFSYSI